MFFQKFFGKLSKAGIVSSVSGVKGGYRLSKSPEEISFWDVVEAVEGPKPIFNVKILKIMVICIEKAAVQLPPFAPSI